MLEKAFKDDVFNTVDLLTIVHDVVSSCGMKNSLIARRIVGAIEHLEMIEADESNLIKACAMAENEARAGSEKSADTVILAALNNSVDEQETSAGKIQVSEKSDGITLLDSITDPTGVEVRHVIDTEENSIVDLTQSVGSNYNIVSSDNAHVLEQRDTSPSPLADPSVSDEDIVADVTKNNTDHSSTASDLASENLEDSQACVPISSRKRSIVSEDEMLEAQSVSGKRARIEEAIDSAKNDDTTINSDISDENNGEQNCHLPSEPKSTIPREFIGNTSLLNDGSDTPLTNLKRKYGRISRHFSDSAVTPSNLAEPPQSGDEKEADNVEDCSEVFNETADSTLGYSTPGTKKKKPSWATLTLNK
ncbi:hypothetical protein QAD02_003430 [Eretmocerus hayati]|uniref:Uncharacterized protein n=1 Tax=Eretmocerus hayati TaxID=131215 RepID=A0ACC2NM20_9HYME|nr:hypothetical protein QAD02_003430 [Eretmocerus hayati]